jgi:hypothetical protein
MLIFCGQQISLSTCAFDISKLIFCGQQIALSKENCLCSLNLYFSRQDYLSELLDFVIVAIFDGKVGLSHNF